MATSPPGRESRRLHAVQAGVKDASLEDIKGMALRLAKEADELEERALLDDLTKVWNRGAILDLAARELALASVNKHSTGLLLLDIDYFKRVNDQWGHPAGDEVLRQVASRILDGVRPCDAVGRYGGEEFLIVLPQCTEENIFSVGERVRMEICKVPIVYDEGSVRITVSIGCTVSPDGEHFVDMMIKAADQALYRAKHTGRNRTEIRKISPSIMSMKASSSRRPPSL